MHSTDFVVARDDLQQSKVIDTQLPDAAVLSDDALLVKVTRLMSWGLKKPRVSCIASTAR